MSEEKSKSLIKAMADRYDMDPAEFYRVIRATVMPREATNEQTAAFLMVAREYGLSPMLKEIHAFANRKTGGIVPMISIDGWATMTNRQPQYDGVEFSYEQDDRNRIISCTCTMWRKDRSHPTVVTEFLVECAKDSDAWRNSPARMLRHRAYIQAARLTFGLSSAWDEENAPYQDGFVDITPKSEPVIEAVQEPHKATQAAHRPPPAPKRNGNGTSTPSKQESSPAAASKASNEAEMIIPPVNAHIDIEVYVDALSTRLKACQTVEDVNLLWLNMDVDDTAEHCDDDEARSLITQMRAKALKRVAGAAKR
jgi:phage recombination protein Bet